ncbi:MAG: NAD(P)-dependent oxidoreductase [Arhodomonas sp.]|nr:NAD(P)-dependent oxidoreductase [Arhodomonas sp.]
MSDLQTGFVGLGTMGAPMAWRLHDGDLLAAVYNRSPHAAAAFGEAGVTVAESPAQLASMVEVVVIMVTDDEALEAVLESDNGVMRKLRGGSLVVNMSTVSREANLRAREMVQGAGGRFLEAPVSGTRKPAEAGALTVLAGGEAADLEHARPLFERIGKATVHCGEVGQATDTKHAVNLLLAGMMQSFSEALVFGSKRGVPAETILEAITTGATNSPLYEAKGKAITARNFEKQFPVRLLKDLDLAMQAGRESGTYLPLTATVRECVNAANAGGHGDEDMAGAGETAGVDRWRRGPLSGLSGTARGGLAASPSSLRIVSERRPRRAARFHAPRTQQHVSRHQ